MSEFETIHGKSYKIAPEWWMKYVFDPTKVIHPRASVYSLDLSWRCNLACSFCPFTDLPKIDMTWETIKSSIDMAYDESCGIELSGGGEPTLSPYFEVVVDYLEFIRPLGVGLITNGTKLDQVQYYCERLTPLRNTWIRISLNHRQILPELLDLINKYPYYIGFSLVATEKTYDLCVENQEKLLQYPVKYVRLRKANTGQVVLGKGQMTPMQCEMRKFVKLIEPDGTIAYCCHARNLNGSMPLYCNENCKFIDADLAKIWQLNPWT